MDSCLFCKIEKGEIPATKVYDGDRIFAIEDINPQAPVHTLIIPKKHLSTLMDVKKEDEPLMGEIVGVGNQLAGEKGLDETGYRLVANCGAGAGQSVFHIHFHLLGGRPMKWPPG